MSTRIIAIFVRLLLCSGLLLASLIIPTPVTPAYAATITVTTDADSGAGSLRQAIADAAAGSSAPGSARPSEEVFSPSAITTTTTLTSTVNPALVGQPVTLTALISPTAATGTVQFYVDGVAFGSPQSISSGSATLVTTTLSATVQPITATYGGDANYDPSTSALLAQGVYARPAVSTGWYHTCEPKPDGTLACWGTNNEGQITVPEPNANWVQVSAQGYHTCGLKADGALACWGRNSEGENNVPDPNGNWVQVSAGFVHTCGLKSNGTLACWGQDDFGQIAVPNPNADWVQVSAGSYHTCGLRSNGTLVCWGSGLNWVPAPNADWVQVSAGYAATCGVKANGTLQCWGEDIFDDGKNIVPSPNENWVQVSTSNYHTCGLKSDGALLCWGRNDYGQCTVPAPNTDWVQVSTGSNHTCGLKADGTLRCWGANHSGQAPVITLWPVTLPNAVLNREYSPPLSAYGGSAAPYTFTVTAGAVPSGLTLNPNGTWSGTPTAAGTFTFTVQARDANNLVGTQDYTLTVKADTTITLTSNPNPSNVGQSVTFTASVTSNAGTPTGFITLTLDETAVPLPVSDAGTVVYSTAALTEGLHTVSAAYGGDANFLPSSQTLAGGQTVGAAYLEHLTLTVQPASLYANGLDEARVTVTATTATGDGAPLAGRTISLTLDAGLGSLSNPIVTLDVNGVATTTFTAAATPGLETLTATTSDHGLTQIATATLTLNPNPLTGRLTSHMGPVITYTFVITNASLAEQTVVLSGSLPLQTVLVSVTNGSAVTTGGDYGWGYVQAQDLKLAAGQSYTLVWSVRPLTWLGDIITQAHAASSQARLRLPVVNTIYRVFILTLFNNWP